MLGGAWLPTDGYIDPSQLTYALADGARRGGCRIFTETRVTGIEVRDGRVRGVRTERGDVDAEVVVDAGGMFAAEIARMAGVRVPLIPMSHQYLVTQPLDAVREARGSRPRIAGTAAGERAPPPHPARPRPPRLLPRGRRRAGDGRLRAPERTGLPARRAGGFDAIPPDFNGRLLEEDWERFEEITENSKRRVPAMDEITVTKLINGPEAFTPDNEFCLGESEVAGFFVCAGFCAHGLAGAGGIGKVVAEWIVDGEPSLDLWEMDIRRFGPQYRSPVLHPRADPRELRDLLRHPLPQPRAPGGPAAADLARQRLAPRARRRLRREIGLGAGQLVRVERRRRRRGAAAARLGRAELVAGDRRRAPRHAARRSAIFDETSFAKLEIEGPGAADFLEGLCDNRVARGVGQITYTQMLNRRGGIECDFTVARLGEERFGIVTGTAFGNHDREWMRRHLPADGSVRIADVTSQWACFGVWGPRAREVLAPLTPADLGNEAFPYMTLREITVGDVPVRALRVTYVGELGWELYCPTEYGLGLWRALWEAGQEHGIVAGGYRAIDSMRLEKGYRVWGADITPDETPTKAGSASASSSTRSEFIGRDALVAAKEDGPRTRLRLPRARGPALDRARQRAGAGRRRGRRPGDDRRLRLHGRALDRLRLPAARMAEPGTPVAIEIFGSWVERRGRGRAALRSGGRADQVLSPRRQQAGEDVLGALDVLAHQPARRAGRLRGAAP